MRYGIRFLVSPFVMLALASCGSKPTPDQSNRRPVVFVEVEIARKAPITSTITATGTITAKNEVKVIAQAEGKITFLGVEEGDKVKEGQMLVKLDATILAAQAKEAEANVGDAKASYDRVDRLFKANLVSEQEYEQARTRYNVLEARLDYQRALLKYTTIQSPISGIITYRGVREGDVAVPRAHLLTVSDPATLVMEINISELEVPRVKVGDPVRVRVDAYPDQGFQGTVRRIFPSSDALTRQVKVEIELTGKDGGLFPGLFARAELTTARKENATVLSNDAILTGGDGRSAAFVVVDSLVQRRDLRIGIRDGSRSEILDGVQPGEKAVVAGQNALNPGMAVRITKER
ncbi:MAG: efflux RND transporter periplasmic adaptor subunit [Ignavibacteriales bacterium]|nr:efflux RND transporter periplasmic adaptor subunit [Ignavibacteriales bacterium]